MAILFKEMVLIYRFCCKNQNRKIIFIKHAKNREGENERKGEGWGREEEKERTKEKEREKTV